jgi:hypothetical protein
MTSTKKRERQNLDSAVAVALVLGALGVYAYAQSATESPTEGNFARMSVPAASADSLASHQPVCGCTFRRSNSRSASHLEAEESGS